MTTRSSTDLFIVTGEASGDELGASLVHRMRAAGTMGDLRLRGVGGASLVGAGLSPLYPMSDIAVMGFAAVVTRLRTILDRIDRTVEAVLRDPPDLLLTIDSPDFTLRVAQRVRARNPDIPILHWVCPSVWAWRPSRARRMKPHVDALMTLLPFEPGVLASFGGPRGIYVGHPLIERLQDIRPTGDDLQRRADLSQPTILVLPGSRRSEIDRHMPTFRDVVTSVAKVRPGARFTLPTVPHLEREVRSIVRGWPVIPTVVIDEGAKFAAFRRARAALAASGTVTLELALAQVPMVTTYRVGALEAAIARRLIRVPTVILPNLILGENIVPEYLQEQSRPRTLCEVLLQIIAEGPSRRSQLDGFARLETAMRSTKEPPSDMAARIVREMVGET